MCARPADPRARDTLLKAARAEFARRGLAGARVEDIARRAGVSKGAFYLHFDSKDAAFEAILRAFLERLAEQALARAGAQEGQTQALGPLSVEDVVLGTPRFLEAMSVELRCDVDLLETLWANREIMKVLGHAEGSPHWRLIDDFRRRMRLMVAGNLTGKRAAGILRPEVDADAVADLVVGGYEAFSRRMLTLRKKPDLTQWALSVITVVYRGALELRAPPAWSAAAAAARGVRGGGEVP
jgi:AcrR family transcriptional regulator